MCIFKHTYVHINYLSTYTYCLGKRKQGDDDGAKTPAATKRRKSSMYFSVLSHDVTVQIMIITAIDICMHASNLLIREFANIAMINYQYIVTI